VPIVELAYRDADGGELLQEEAQAKAVGKPARGRYSRSGLSSSMSNPETGLGLMPS
jgi:hypothetical protein